MGRSLSKSGIVGAFFEGSPAFNAIDLMIGVAGLLLAIYALLAAWRAGTVAKEAKSEAALAREQLRNITLSVELASFGGRVREAVAWLRAPEFAAAIVCLEFVKSGLGRASRLPLGSKLGTPAEWRMMDGQIASAVDALRQWGAVQPGPTALDLVPLVSTLVEIGTRLARMQAMAEVKSSGE